MNNDAVSQPKSAGAPSDGNRRAKLCAIGASIVVLGLLPVFVNSAYTLHIFILTFIYVIVTVSLRTITTSGQFPLAQGAFMGVGAYAAGMASRWLGWSCWLTIPVGSLVHGGPGDSYRVPLFQIEDALLRHGEPFLWAGGSTDHLCLGRLDRRLLWFHGRPSYIHRLQGALLLPLPRVGRGLLGSVVQIRILQNRSEPEGYPPVARSCFQRGHQRSLVQGHGRGCGLFLCRPGRGLLRSLQSRHLCRQL